MAMDEILELLLVCAAGGVLGAIFFGGLWWTLGKVVSSGQPALWLFGSLLLRTGIVVLGFYFVLAGNGGNWQRLLASLLGFVIARIIVTRLTRVTQQSGQLAQEASHAP